MVEKSNTYYQKNNGNKMYRRLKKVEHICLVQELGGLYMGHLMSKSGTGSDIAKSISCYLERKNLDPEQLVVIGCDGAVTNNGRKNDVIRNIEVKVGRPMQWFTCLLHFNELPYKHFSQYLDGETTDHHVSPGKLISR